MSKFDAGVFAIASALSIAGCNGDDGSEPPLFDPDEGEVTHGDPKVRLSPTSGLVTTEGGGSASFAVELTERPRADVKILLHSTNPAEGVPDVDQIVFTPSDWSKRTVTVHGIDDHIVDGGQQFQVILDPTFSDDLDFQGLATGQIYLTNVDDDAAGVTISTTQSTSIEENGAVTFDVRLNTRPTGEVRVHLASVDPARATLSASDLVFVPVHWDVPQQVTVNAVSNLIDDGNIDVTIDVAPLDSTDIEYLGLDPDDVTVHVFDDDTAVINVGPLQATEINDRNGSTYFELSLATQPTANVTIYIAASPSGQVKVSSVTFTPTDYHQTVTVEAVVDQVADGDHQVTLSLTTSSADPKYSQVWLRPLSLTVKDGDKAGISASFETYQRTTYEGWSPTCAEGSVHLTSKPKADVFVRAVISKPNEASSVYTLLFTPDNATRPITAQICGVDDPYVDGDQAYTVKFVVYQTTDADYANLETAPLDFNNIDNDHAGVLVTKNGTSTTEAGGTVMLFVRLSAKPTDNVTIHLGTTKPAEAIVSPTSLVFTPDNYNTEQIVTVTGQDDTVDDGDVQYSVTVTSSESSDPNFSGLNTILATLKNLDND